MVGIVRTRLVTSPGFLRRPVLRYATDHLVTPRHADAFAIVVFVHDTLGVLSDAIRSLEWLFRAAVEAIGRAAASRRQIWRVSPGSDETWRTTPASRDSQAELRIQRERCAKLRGAAENTGNR